MSDQHHAQGSHHHSEFVKALTLTDATMLVAGSMIGSGIFIVSADIARVVQSPMLLLAVWAVTGLLTLIATGHTGGDLVYKHGAGVTTAPQASQPIAQNLHGG